MAAGSSLPLIGKHPSLVVEGSDATYKTSKADVTAWSKGLGCHDLDFQPGGILTDRGAWTYACIVLLGLV